MKIRAFSRAYTTRDNRIAARHVIGTVVAYGAALAGAIGFAGNWPVMVPLMAAVAVAAVRLYLLQHECGHGSLFDKRRLNDRVGRALAVFTMTPYMAARYNHNLHHAHIGDLEERDSSEIYTMTLAEYRAADPWLRLGYRLYRSAPVLFVIGPFYLAMIRYRLPKNWRKSGPGDVVLHNLMVAAYFAAIWALAGTTGLWVMLGCIVMAGAWGAFIPYAQHNFENVYWERHPDLDFETAALQGSAVIDFGRLYDFLTLNIAYHDLHHLNANIPFYNLRRCHDDMQPMLNSHRIGLRAVLGSLRWKLWDEEAGRMVSFPPLWGARNRGTDLQRTPAQ